MAEHNLVRHLNQMPTKTPEQQAAAREERHAALAASHELTGGETPTNVYEEGGSQLPADLTAVVVSLLDAAGSFSEWDFRYAVEEHGLTEEQVLLALGRLHVAGVVRLVVEEGPELGSAVALTGLTTMVEHEYYPSPEEVEQERQLLAEAQAERQ